MQEQALPVRIHCKTLEKLNFACHQCAIAFLQELHIENMDSAQRFDDLFVTLTSKTWRLDSLAPSGTISIQTESFDCNHLLRAGILASVCKCVNRLRLFVECPDWLQANIGWA